VQATRLDCAIASAGLMRMALVSAIHHCRHRSVFQKKLYDQPMMRAVLADMALEMEGAVALIMRLCRAHDLAAQDPHEAAYARLLTPVAKYWICKLAPAFVYEAMECLGGNGYVEDSILPRLYREAPVNAIWEGSGNVMALDVLRAIKGDDRVAELVATLLGQGAAASSDVAFPDDEVSNEASARALAGKLAMMASAAALKATAPAAIAEAYLRLRLTRPRGPLYGANNIAPEVADMMLQRAMTTP